MGLLDSIMGNATGQQGNAAAGSGGALSALLPVVIGMVTGSKGGGGGLSGMLGGLMGGQDNAASPGGPMGSLLEKFREAGMGEQVKSWVGTGQNLPISPDAINQVLGSDSIARIAQQAGISESEASSGLSQLLPEVVDQLTPEGRLPDLSQIGTGVTGLLKRFGA